jgi:uncharacterized membrane protein (DUF4010 family)
VAPQFIDRDIFALFAALLLGFLLGSERGWHDRNRSEGLRFAGVRTFVLIALLGAICGIVSQKIESSWLFLTVGFICVSAMLITAHILSSSDDHDQGLTTVVAAMICFWLGVLPCYDLTLIAAISAVAIAFVLHLKSPLHHFLAQLRSQELAGMLQFLVISVVMLPLLSNHTIDPWEALNPYLIWWLVVLICGLQMFGYFATRWLSNRWGALVTSFFGGMISSTAVTLSLAKLQPQLKTTRILSSAILLACAVMYLRLSVVVLILNLSLLRELALPLLAASVILLGCATYYALSNTAAAAPIELTQQNPFQLWSAMGFGVLLTVVFVAAKMAQFWLGNAGLYTLATLSRFTDVDAISLSLLEQSNQGLANSVATLAIMLLASTEHSLKSDSPAIPAE